MHPPPPLPPARGPARALGRCSAPVAHWLREVRSVAPSFWTSVSPALQRLWVRTRAVLIRTGRVCCVMRLPLLCVWTGWMLMVSGAAQQRAQREDGGAPAAWRRDNSRGGGGPDGGSGRTAGG